VLSLVCSGTVQVWWMMNAKSVADHSRRGLETAKLHYVIVLVLGTIRSPRAAEQRQRRPVLAATGTHISVR